MSISDKSDAARDDAMKAFVLAAGFSLGLATAAMKRLGEVANRFAQAMEDLAESLEHEIPPPPEPPTGDLGATGPYPPPPPYASGSDLRPNSHGVVPGVPIS